MDLDQLLREAAPADPTADTDELRTMARAAERVARPRRRRPALVVGGILATLAVGGAAAAGTGVLPIGRDLATPSGQTCHLDHTVVPASESGVVDAAHPAFGTLAEQRAAAVAARTFLDGYGGDAKELEAAVARWQRIEDRVIGEAAPGEAQPRLSGDELLVTASNSQIVADLRAHLRARGHSIDSISLATGWRCSR